MSAPQPHPHIEALDAMVTRLATASAGRRAMAEQAAETFRSAMTEEEEALRYQERAKAVADLGAELIGLARAWHHLADLFDVNPVSLSSLAPGQYSSSDIARHLRNCAIDVERTLQTAVHAVEL